MQDGLAQALDTFKAAGRLTLPPMATGRTPLASGTRVSTREAVSYIGACTAALSRLLLRKENLL